MSRIAFCAEVAPLSVNRAYAPARWGKRHGFRKTEAAEAYAAALKGAVPLASMLHGPVRVSITFYWPTEAGDVDGPIKLTLDALQGSVYENDRQVKELHILRLTDKARPRVMVEVEEIVPGAANAVQPKPGPAPERKTAGRRLLKSNASKRLVASVRSFRGEG